jgi:hypothetical protein
MKSDKRFPAVSEKVQRGAENPSEEIASSLFFYRFRGLPQAFKGWALTCFFTAHGIDSLLS